MKAPDGQTQFPDVFWSPVVDQYGPNGNQVIKNPLYSYSFRESGGFGDKWYPVRTSVCDKYHHPVNKLTIMIPRLVGGTKPNVRLIPMLVWSGRLQ